MKKIAVLGAALALSVMTAPVAFAQDEPSCAEAQLSFARAQEALDAALADDKAATDAKAADAELARAERALDGAREAALSGGVPVANQTAADAARLRADLAELEKVPVGDRSPEQQARIDDIKKKLPLIDAVVSAQVRVTNARTVADKTDADRLQDVADLTDVAALGEARDEARKAADKACGGITTTPPTPTPAPFPVDLDCKDLTDAEAQKILDSDLSDPHNLDSDEDGLACDENDFNVVTPSGGVATGGGPA